MSRVTSTHWGKQLVHHAIRSQVLSLSGLRSVPLCTLWINHLFGTIFFCLPIQLVSIYSSIPMNAWRITMEQNFNSLHALLIWCTFEESLIVNAPFSTLPLLSSSSYHISTLQHCHENNKSEHWSAVRGDNPWRERAANLVMIQIHHGPCIGLVDRVRAWWSQISSSVFFLMELVCWALNSLT